MRRNELILGALLGFGVENEDVRLRGVEGADVRDVHDICRGLR